jgi:hypothetical protein
MVDARFIGDLPMSFSAGIAANPWTSTAVHGPMLLTSVSLTRFLKHVTCQSYYFIPEGVTPLQWEKATSNLAAWANHALFAILSSPTLRTLRALCEESA